MQIKGVVVGTVNEDENGRIMDDRGRIRLTLPLTEGGTESNLAPIAVPLASQGNGIQFMPEAGNQAVVAFRDGNPRFPIVLGYLWNDKDQPPRDKPEKRTIQTVSGHILEFDDSDGDETITIKHSGEKAQFVLSNNALEISFGTSKITLNDQGVMVEGPRIDLNP